MARHRVGSTGSGWFWIPVIVVVVFLILLAYGIGVSEIIDWFVRTIDSTGTSEK